MYDKKKIVEALAKVLEDKGKRKFTQSVDIAVNFQDLDFKKTENRISLDVVLPLAPKKVKVGIFADGEVAFNAKKVADLVISTHELEEIGKDKKKQGALFDYSFLAMPTMMAPVGKILGKVLGGKGKLPKPLLPGMKVEDAVEKTRRTVSLKTKGKALPVVHCIVGNEAMTAEQLAENVLAVVEAVEKTVSETQIASIYLKTTMGKPVKIAA